MRGPSGVGVRVVFVCTGNICRSPSAEAVLKHKLALVGLDDRVHASCEGLLSHLQERLAGALPTRR